MKRGFVALILLCVAALSSYTFAQVNPVHADELKDLGSRAITLCLEKISQATDNPLSAKADRADVYIHDDSKAISVQFTHGALGTFLKRDKHYALVMGCGILRKPWLRVVLLFRPLGDLVFYAPGADYLYLGKGVKITHSVELWYARSNNKFNFMKMQKFSFKNLLRNNPELFKKPKCNLNSKVPPPATPPSPAWIKKHPGCILPTHL